MVPQSHRCEQPDQGEQHHHYRTDHGPDTGKGPADKSGWVTRHQQRPDGSTDHPYDNNNEAHERKTTDQVN